MTVSTIIRNRFSIVRDGVPRGYACILSVMSRVTSCNFQKSTVCTQVLYRWAVKGKGWLVGYSIHIEYCLRQAGLWLIIVQITIPTINAGNRCCHMLRELP